MLPSLCMDITDSDQSGVAWHRLDSPRKPEAYIRPSTCLRGHARPVGGSRNPQCVYLKSQGDRAGIDTQCAGADTGRLRTERWDEKGRNNA